MSSSSRDSWSPSDASAPRVANESDSVGGGRAPRGIAYDNDALGKVPGVSTDDDADAADALAALASDGFAAYGAARDARETARQRRILCGLVSFVVLAMTLLAAFTVYEERLPPALHFHIDADLARPTRVWDVHTERARLPPFIVPHHYRLMLHPVLCKMKWK